jgi:hypothetical protein
VRLAAVAPARAPLIVRGAVRVLREVPRGVEQRRLFRRGVQLILGVHFLDEAGGQHLVVEERLADDGLLERLLRHLLVDARLLDGGALLGEDLLQLGDAQPSDAAPDALRGDLVGLLAGGRERREVLLGLLGRFVPSQRLEHVRGLGWGVSRRAAHLLLPVAPELLLPVAPDLLEAALGDAGGALRRRGAPDVAGKQLRARHLPLAVHPQVEAVPLLVAVAALAGVEFRWAELGGVPRAPAVAAHLLEELGAAHLAVGTRLVLDEMASKDGLGEPLRLAEGAEFLEPLGGGALLVRDFADGRHF